VEVEEGVGGHGGGDPVMLRDILISRQMIGFIAQPHI